MKNFTNNGNPFEKYSRKTIVYLYYSGQSAKNSSRTYGISDIKLYSWIKKFSLIQPEDGSSINQDDYAKLQK